MLPTEVASPRVKQSIGKKENKMLNNVVMVGRLVDDPTNENGKGTITIAIPRSFKNENGEYETDFIPVVLWGVIANNVAEYCRKGDIVGVKGRIQSNESGIYIVADKITFLTRKKTGEE